MWTTMVLIPKFKGQYSGIGLVETITVRKSPIVGSLVPLYYMTSYMASDRGGGQGHLSLRPNWGNNLW